jgi:ABC-type antimicrobial peptide transport system permease subunit
VSPAAADRAVEAVREELRGVKGFDGFSELPAVRKPGEYPGKEVFEQIASVMTAVTLLALLSALVLLQHDDDAHRRADLRDRGDEGRRRFAASRYALARGIISLTGSTANLELRFVFPATNVAITLVGTVLLAVLVLLAPVRRAVRFKPGEALRYA